MNTKVITFFVIRNLDQECVTVTDRAKYNVNVVR